MRMVLIIALTFLGGCATEEWLNTSQECDQMAYAAHPKKIESRIVTRTKSISVPDGRVSCITSPAVVGRETQTNCTQGTTTQDIPYQEVITVDVNRDAQLNFWRSCTRDLCIKRYGNSGCEVAKATVQPSVSNPTQSISQISLISPTTPTPEVADPQATLIRFFGREWVSKPRGVAAQGFGRFCGDNGTLVLPLNEINTVRYHAFSGVIQVGKVNWSQIFVPCTQILFDIKGSQSDSELIKSALIKLGAKID